MRIKTLALSLALVLGVISTVEARTSVIPESSFAHPESSLEKEQHMSPEKSFVERNNSESTNYDKLEKKNNTKEKSDSSCGVYEPDCQPNVQDKKIEVK
ncbi:MAG: hypothetical protein K2W92_02270 [Alphaproteobacteria bacterium]|nr:hypothetical protein [Alphaproteobacteria bacterium]